MIDCSPYSSEILDCVDWVRSKAAPGAKIRIDSRSIEQGDVFAALHGATVDGLAYAAVAASRHASALCADIISLLIAILKQMPVNYSIPL